MRAAVAQSYGGPEAVEIRDVEAPEPAVDQVLVRVRAASVNRADLDLLHPRPSFTRLFLGLRRPRNPRVGCDMAGVVERVGPDVTRFRQGDRVFGDLYSFGRGSFADLVCVPERALAGIPEGVSFEAAATLPHSAILAIQGLRLRDGRAVGRGDRVLIDGASGNVGPFAVQIARWLGAEVTATCSLAKADLVRSLGVDDVLDYRAVDYTRTGERYDWILDTDGHHPLLAVRRALRPNGVYVTLGGTASTLLQALLLGPVIGLATGKRMGLLVWWKPFRSEDVATLGGLVAAGTVVPLVDRAVPLDHVGEALRLVDEGLARGKIVVKPSG